MRPVLALARREVRSQAATPVAWIVWTLFLLLGGWFFFNLVSQFGVLLSNYEMYAQLTSNPALLDRLNLNDVVLAGLFRNLLLLLAFFVPVVTMRGFAEERRHGTDELLLTAPVTPGQIVAGKFLGLLVVTGALAVLPLVFVAILVRYGDPEMGPVATGLLGLVLAVSALTAMGLAVSTTTRSQMMAAIGSFVLFLVLFVLDWPAESVEGWMGRALRGLSFPGRFDPLAQGLVTSPDVLYFLSLTAAGLFVARASVASQRWR